MLAFSTVFTSPFSTIFLFSFGCSFFLCSQPFSAILSLPSRLALTLETKFRAAEITPMFFPDRICCAHWVRPFLEGDATLWGDMVLSPQQQNP
jgi:hypothetical protein